MSRIHSGRLFLIGATLAFAGLLVAGIAAHAPAPSEIQSLEQAVQRAIAKAEPAIACVLVKRGNAPASMNELGEVPPEFFGSGVVIDHEKRLVLTNYHVVKDATSIGVRLPASKSDGPSRTSNARIFAADSRSDLAVLRLSENITGSAIEFGKAEDLRKGSFVIALSNPYAVGFLDGSPSAAWGIVGNFRRRLPGSTREEDRTKTLHHYGTLLHTDARIELGGSGGALLDMEGRLVGLLTSQAALQGSEASGGFAVPMDAGMRRVIDVLRKGEEVEYGFLGVATERIINRRSPSSSNGVVLDRVSHNSPADKAGLERGDVIVAINGQPVRDYDDMFLHIGLGLAGRESTFRVIRNGEKTPTEVKVTLAKFYVPDFGQATNRPADVHGLRVDYSSIISRTGDQPMPDGVVVREVVKGSPAEAAQLYEMADIITAVNGVRVHTPAQFYDEAKKAVQSKSSVRLTIAQPPRTVTLP